MFIEYYYNAPEHVRATGRDWYTTAHETTHEYATAWGLPLPMVAGIIAALSPRQSWATNLRMARLCIAGERPRGLSDPINKAMRIRAGESPETVLRGDKVRAFYRAILGDTTAVVLDVWMLRTAAFAGSKPTPKQYREIADTLTAEAHACGECPAHFQAIVWCQIRGKAF